MKFSEYMLEWLSFKRMELEVSTFEAYIIYTTKHLIPYFAGVELEKLRPMEIQRYISDKLDHGRCDGKGGLSRVSVRKHIQVIREALDQAVRLELIEKNPAAAVRLPRSQRGSEDPKVFLELSEAKDLLTAFEGNRLYPIILVTLLYGFRRSEALGLTWSAIDFENDVISVSNTIVKNLTIVEKKTTKNDTSRRKFTLFSDVKAELQRLKISQESYRRFRTIAGVPYFESDYVFTWEDGRPYRPDYIYKRFQKDLQKYGLKKMRFHDLRHSTASILFDRGWDIKDVQEWLGHADSSTTADIYVHYGRARKKLVAQDLEGLFIKDVKILENPDEKRKNAH